MALRDELMIITQRYKNSFERIEHNNTLFNIYEGDLLTYIKRDLQKQLSANSYSQVLCRIAPINVLKRLVDKLSRIYSKAPARVLKLNVDKDGPLFDELAEALDYNTVMAYANEYFNLFKCTALEPYLDRGVPCLRVLPADRFIVASVDTVNPLRPTHFSKIMGVTIPNQNDPTTFTNQSAFDSATALNNQTVYGSSSNKSRRIIFHTYTDDEFLIHDQNGVVFEDEMAKLDNPDGVNPYGRIPAVYINRSKQTLIPEVDSDTLAMTKLFPILLSDLNFAMMYQCFTIIYGKNITSDGLEMAPNAFWNLKTDASQSAITGSTDSEIGVISPKVDSDKALALITTTLALWLESKNIKPGSAKVSKDGMASGLSKMVDEMDTCEDRQKQVPYFVQAEKQLFDLIVNHMHPVWIADAEYTLTKQSFSPNQSAQISFDEQRPSIDVTAVLNEQILRLQNGIQTKARAIGVLEPDLTEEEIDEILEAIDFEKLSSPLPEAVDANGEDITDNETTPMDGSADEVQGQGSAGADGKSTAKQAGGTSPEAAKPPVKAGKKALGKAQAPSKTDGKKSKVSGAK